MKVFNKQTENTEDLQCSSPLSLLSFERAMQTRLDKLQELSDELNMRIFLTWLRLKQQTESAGSWPHTPRNLRYKS